MTGKRKKKLLFVLLALVFSLGSISVGYAYWTDRLDMEGDAEVRFSVNIIDDVIDRPVSPAALQLIEVPLNDNDNEGSDGNLSPDSLTPQLPEIVEPEKIEPEPEKIAPEPEKIESEPEKIESEPEKIEPVNAESDTEKPAADDNVVQTPEE